MFVNPISTWRRAAITLGLLACLLMLLGAGVFENYLPRQFVVFCAQLLNFLPLAMVASQFAAMYLVQATVQK